MQFDSLRPVRQRLKPLATKLLQEWGQLRPYLHICRLHRPVDLILLLLPALWTLSLGPGNISASIITLLLSAATALRCAAWVYNDLYDAEHLKEAPESFVARGLVGKNAGWRLFFVLLVLTLTLALAIDVAMLPWGGVAALLLVAYPYIKQRTLLTQAYLGFSYAWIVAVTQVVTPDLDLKTLWLLFTATLLWATANTMLYTIPRHHYETKVGIGSLVTLLGETSGLFIAILQLSAVIALFLVGKQSEFGISYGSVLLFSLALILLQQWLLSRHPIYGAIRAYRLNIGFGLLIWLGLLAEIH